MEKMEKQYSRYYIVQEVYVIYFKLSLKINKYIHVLLYVISIYISSVFLYIKAGL